METLPTSESRAVSLDVALSVTISAIVSIGGFLSQTIAVIVVSHTGREPPPTATDTLPTLTWCRRQSDNLPP